MESALSRRRFLKLSVASLATAAVLGNMSVRAVANTVDRAKKGMQKIPTFCSICFWKCGAVATVVDGKLEKIEGNPDDPLCKGRLCPRGTGGIGAHYDDDRLKSPLIRTRERGEEEWKAVTWDEALDYIAEKNAQNQKGAWPGVYGPIQPWHWW